MSRLRVKREALISKGGFIAEREPIDFLLFPPVMRLATEWRFEALRQWCARSWTWCTPPARIGSFR